jgi:hypothetical protein
MHTNCGIAVRATTLAGLATASLIASPWPVAAAQLSEANIYFELNNSDGDLGLHAAIDGDPWRSLRVRDADNRTLLNIRAWGGLSSQGMTQLAFESAEPNFDDLEPADFFARFPEGTYRLFAWGNEGGIMRAESQVRHVLPAAPDGIEVSGQPVAPTCDEEDPDYDEGLIPSIPAGEPVVVSWDAVTESHPTLGTLGPIEVERYQVFVSVETQLGGAPFTSEYAFDLEPTVRSVQVPEAILGLGDAFKLEVLVKEREGGNQSATETCFFIE